MNEERFVQITRSSRIPESELPLYVNAMYERVWARLYPPQILTDELSALVSENVVTPEEAPVPDCMTCGACCGALVTVPTAPADRVEERFTLDIIAESEGEEFVTDRYLRRREEDLACSALDGDVGVEVSCTIYETRPSMCRDFEAGSDRCRAIRRAYGIDPFLSLQEMSSGRERLRAKREGSGKHEDVIERVEIVNSGNGRRTLRFILADGTSKEVREYDPGRETWFKAQFEGIGLRRALKKIDEAAPGS